MTTIEEEGQKITSLSNQEIKLDEINPKINTTKLGNNNLAINSKYKKLVLPQIQKQKKTFNRVKSFNHPIKSSHSQINVFSSQDSKSNLYLKNEEKDKLIIEKMNLARLTRKINEINNSYKKLLYEKEENLGILREAISSNDYTYSEGLYKKVDQMLEEALKKNVNNNNQISNNSQQINEENQNYNKSEKNNENKDKSGNSENKENKENIENNENNENKENKENIENNENN